MCHQPSNREHTAKRWLVPVPGRPADSVQRIPEQNLAPRIIARSATTRLTKYLFRRSVVRRQGQSNEVIRTSPISVFTRHRTFSARIRRRSLGPHNHYQRQFTARQDVSRCAAGPRRAPEMWQRATHSRMSGATSAMILKSPTHRSHLKSRRTEEQGPWR